jgi:TonB-linked SusC/RagA family outer membrane protein
MKRKSPLLLLAVSSFLPMMLISSIVIPTNLHAQTSSLVVVNGIVTNAAGEPLSGVSVSVKGTSLGTSTKSDGSFSLRVPNAKSVLVFSSVGFNALEQSASAIGAGNVVLVEAAKNLSDVVVIGYGTQKKISVSGSISSVTPKQILQAPVSSVANALAGRASGIIAVQRSGEPGRDIADIFIRGVGTFAGGTAANPLILVDGVERPLSGIDPYTIESFNILKDASATAVFGVRGANGVIIITTKTGEKGKPQFSFSSNAAWQNPIRLPKQLGAYDYAVLRNEAESNDNGPTARKFSDWDLERFQKKDDPYFHPDVNWMDYMLKKYAPQQQYNLNVSGGGQDNKYFVSLGFLNQDGAYKLGDFFKDFTANPNYKRYNIRTNFDFNLSKDLTVAIKASSEIGNSNYSASNTSDIFGTIFSANPIMSPIVYDGKMVRNVEGLASWQISNTPLYQMLSQGYNTNYHSRLNTNLSARYRLDAITKGLALRGMVAYDSYYLQQVKRTKQIPMYDLKRNPAATNFQDSIVPIAVVNQYEGPTNFNSEAFSKNRKWYGEAALEYSRTLGRHSVSGLVLGTMERYYDGGNQLPFNYEGLVGRATYNYRNVYFADVNMGYNGSENFAVGKQFGFFPSVSAGYVISEEKFFPKSKVVDYVKLRGSYGTVGNDKIQGSRFLFLPSSFALGNTYYFGLNHTPMTGYRESSLGNPNVSWEKAVKLNVGIDLKLIKEKLTLTGDYFTERRNQILWRLNVPVTFGNAGLISPYNIGEAKNKGFEIELGFKDNIASKDIRYWVNANYTFARNQIVYMDETPQLYPHLYYTGSRIGQTKGLVADGLYNTWEEVLDPKRPKSKWEGAGLRPGDVRYKDITGDGIIDENDVTNIGDPNIPEIIYGASTGISWKGFEISVFFQGAGNVSTYLQGEGAWPFIAGTKTAFENAKESWSQQRYESGAAISLPRLTASPDANKHNYLRSSYWMRDASYVRLKNLEIGYSFKAQTLKRIGMKNLRLYLSGQNLYTWTKLPYFDPEIPSSNGAVYPMTRVFNIGANIQF